MSNQQESKKIRYQKRGIERSQFTKQNFDFLRHAYDHAYARIIELEQAIQNHNDEHEDVPESQIKLEIILSLNFKRVIKIEKDDQFFDILDEIIGQE